MDGDGRRDAGGFARLCRVAQQVPEYLAQQRLVSLDLSKIALNRDRGALRQVVAQIVGGATSDGAKIDRREQDLFGAREIEKVRDDLPEHFRLLADPLDVRTVLARQGFRIDQPAIAVNRREAIAKLVRDARGKLSQP